MAKRSKPTTDTHGVALDGKRLRSSKPNDDVKAGLYALERDRGYPVDQLSERFCVAPETLRKHARRLDCLRYVETEPGKWVHCVLHPDTAAESKAGV